MRFAYCPDCGRRLDTASFGDERDVPWCEGCKKPWFDMFYCCIIALARRNGRYALVKQRGEDEDKYVCVSGYIKTGETAHEAAAREIKEELGLDVTRLTLISTYVYEKKQMLMTGFCADVSDGEAVLSDELISVRWCDEGEAEKLLSRTSVGSRLIKDIIDLGDD